MSILNCDDNYNCFCKLDELYKNNFANINYVNTKINESTPMMILKNNISYEYFGKRPCLTGYMKNFSIKCLLDTGANINVIHHDLVQNVNFSKSKNLNVKCANGETLNILGVINIKIKFDNIEKNVTFYVSKEIDPSIILGMEFMKIYKIYLDFKYKSILSFQIKTQDSIDKLIKKYDHIFMKHKWDIGCTNILIHKILTDSKPIQINPRRQPVNLMEQIKIAINEMKNNDIIEECSSEWNSPIVCIKKKDTTDIRVCLDFRLLNNVTIRPAYPIPNVDEILDNLSGAKYFSTLDLGNAFYQVKLDDESKIKTAFSVLGKQYCFKRMPFGIAAAPATFQKLMNQVLGDLNGQIAQVYLDDIIIFSKTRDDHIKHIESVFKKIEESGLKIKQEKCHFLKEEIKFLGYIIDRNGLKTDESKIDSIKNFSIPKCVKAVRSFLGLCNYYRRFIKDYTKYCKPLEALTGSKTKKLIWNEECQKSFDHLKTALCNTPVLTFPDYNKTFILDTDASFDRIGAVLSQKDESGFEKVISYGSHSLNKHELGYCITRKELLAVFYFTNKFKHYLYGKRFRLRTDHKAITFMVKTKKPITAQFQTWLNFLTSLDIEFEYREGTKHSNADALSRNTCDNCVQCQMNHEDAKKGKLKTKIITTITNNPFHEYQENITEIDNIKRQIKENNSEFKMLSDLVYTKNNKLWIPEEKKKDFIKNYHILLCHAGSKKLIKYIEHNFDMHNLKSSVKDEIGKCEACQKRKTYTSKTKETINKISETEPFASVYIDICGPFNTTVHGRKYIIGIIDKKTKYIILECINNQNENTITNIVRNRWILKFGAPREIHVDRGKVFEGQYFKNLCESINSKIVYSSPYHHETNGQIERQFRTVRDCIHLSQKSSNTKDWASQIPDIEFMLNSTYQATINESPCEAVFGKKIYRQYHGFETETSYKTTNRIFNIGDKVLIKTNNTNKQAERYTGPGKIIEKIHDRSYKIQMFDKRILIRNIEWLKPFKEGGYES